MCPDESFAGNERAVAPLIGFILLFGLFTISFAGYQATSVPQQNAETEFQHYQNVQNDMIVVRNSISRAGQSDVAQFESVRLGAQYRERILALNPPDPAGTLRTEGPYNITIDNGTEPQNVSTQFLEYRNGYDELEIGSIYYENSVVYLDERDSNGGVAIIQDQNLVVENENGNKTVQATALQNEYQRSAVGRASIELYPINAANTDSFDVSNGANVTIDLPTRLNGSEYWDDELEGFGGYEVDPDNSTEGVGIDENAYEEGVHRLNIEVNIDDLRFNTVGIDDAPEGNNTVKQNVGQVSNGLPDLSFEENEQTATSGDGPNVDEVMFTFEVNNPNNQQFRIEFEVENGGTTTVGPLTTPSSPQTVNIDSTNLQGSGSLDVSITLLASNGNQIRTCDGTINNPNQTITLC